MPQPAGRGVPFPIAPVDIANEWISSVHCNRRSRLVLGTTELILASERRIVQIAD